MTTALAWLAVLLGGLVGAVAAMTLVGWALPRQHTASLTVLLPVPAATVWASLVDPPGQVTWRRDLIAVDRLPSVNDAEVWRERSGRHSLTFRTLESRPTTHLVRQIDDDHGRFRGRWEFQLETVISPGNSRLTVTEHGEVDPPFFRFVNRFVIGRATTLQRFLGDLARKFGGEPRFMPSIEMQREVDAPPP